MDTQESGQYPQEHFEEGRLKLNRDPFGRCLLRVMSEQRKGAHDYTDDQEVIQRAAKLIRKSRSPEEQQMTIATIVRDLAILHLYVLHGDSAAVKPMTDSFMEKVREVMRIGNCTPLLINDLNQTSEKTRGDLARLLRLQPPRK